MTAAARGWRVVIPVKGAPLGKSRLAHPKRHALARAFALDSIDAALAALGPGSLVVVTSDELITPYVEDAGARVVPDPGDGLNAAIRSGLAAVAPMGGPLAVLLGDLPALTAEDLTEALRECALRPKTFIPDNAGSGTVLLAAVGVVPEPAFGGDSAARHERAGYHRLALDLPRLRTDVDVRDDLAHVLSLGCGRHTASVIAASIG